MSGIIKPGAGVLYMKIGTHAQESLEDIIARKTREIDDEGFALWGYGGATCHPNTMVQPFAKDLADGGKPIILCMQPMESKHWAPPVRASKYSADGVTWNDIPDGINALGSRYALKLKSLKAEEHVLPLSQARVALGPSQGKLGSRYIKGHVDKACFEIIEETERGNEADQKDVAIAFIAELMEPYAVFLKI